MTTRTPAFLLAAVIACLVGLAGASAASALTLIYSDDRRGPAFHSKPEKLRCVGNGATVFKDLEWSDWGSERASGVGEYRTCVGAPDCFDAPVELTALKPRRSPVQGDPARYYTKLRITLPQNRYSIPLPLPDPRPPTDRP